MVGTAVTDDTACTSRSVSRREGAAVLSRRRKPRPPKKRDSSLRYFRQREKSLRLRRTIDHHYQPNPRAQRGDRDPTYAEAMLDLVVHNAHRIDLAGSQPAANRCNKASKD